MSIVRVTRVNLEADQEATVRNYQHTYEVQVSSSTEGQTAVLNAAGIPALGSQHPEDFSAVVTSKKARLRDERRWPLWIVDVNYAVLEVTEDAVTSRPPGTPPDAWAPELRVRTATMDREIIEDLDGQILRNAVEDMFPAHMRTITEYYSAISYRRWFRAADFSPVTANRWLAGKVNESAWYEAAAGEAQIQSLSSERELWTPPSGTPQLFFRVDYEIAIRDGGWQITLPNEGVHKWIDFLGLGPVKVPILHYDIGEDGFATGLKYQPSEPVPLKDDGSGELGKGLTPKQFSFRVYDSVDFSAAGL